LSSSSASASSIWLGLSSNFLFGLVKIR